MEDIKKKIGVLREKLEEAEGRSQKVEDELFDAQMKSVEADGECKRLEKEVKNLEEELEASERKLAEMSTRLAEAEKEADESEEARRILEDLGQSEDDRLLKLNMELDEVVARSNEVELRYNQIAGEIEELEVKVSEDEVRCKDADLYVKELESEVVRVGSVLQTMELDETTALKKDEEWTLRLTEMTKRYQESEDKAVKCEQQAADMEATLEQLELKFAEEKDTYQRVKMDLDNLLAEIQSLDD